MYLLIASNSLAVKDVLIRGAAIIRYKPISSDGVKGEP